MERNKMFKHSTHRDFHRSTKEYKDRKQIEENMRESGIKAGNFKVEHRSLAERQKLLLLAQAKRKGKEIALNNKKN